jgi:outer membrane biosynthesis protein TonB
MGIFMSFTDLNMAEYPEGYLSISVIIVYPSSSLIYLNWHATKQDAEVGNPYIQQTSYDVDNSVFTSVDFHTKAYEYLLTLPEFSGGTLEVVSQPEPDPQPEPQPDPQPDPQPEPQPEPDPQPQPDPNTPDPDITNP